MSLGFRVQQGKRETLHAACVAAQGRIRELEQRCTELSSQKSSLQHDLAAYGRPPEPEQAAQSTARAFCQRRSKAALAEAQASLHATRQKRTQVESSLEVYKSHLRKAKLNFNLAMQRVPNLVATVHSAALPTPSTLQPEQSPMQAAYAALVRHVAETKQGPDVAQAAPTGVAVVEPGGAEQSQKDTRLDSGRAECAETLLWVKAVAISHNHLELLAEVMQL